MCSRVIRFRRFRRKIGVQRLSTVILIRSTKVDRPNLVCQPRIASEGFLTATTLGAACVPASYKAKLPACVC